MAIPLSIYRQAKWAAHAFYQDLFSKFAAEKDRRSCRLFLPLVQSSPPLVPGKIQWELEAQGYQVQDYRAGLAVRNGKIKKIGKLLSEDCLRLYTTDRSRQVKGSIDHYRVVISRHPYDLLGMSTGRSWTSCFDLNHDPNCLPKLIQEILHSSLVAYLIRNTDRNIQKPLARVKLVLFHSNAQHPNAQHPNSAILVPDLVYGSPHSSLMPTVLRFCHEFNREQPSQTYSVGRDRDLTSIRTRYIKTVSDAFSRKLNNRALSLYDVFIDDPAIIPAIFEEVKSRKSVNSVVTCLMRKLSDLEFSQMSVDVEALYLNMSQNQRRLLLRPGIKSKRLVNYALWTRSLPLANIVQAMLGSEQAVELALSYLNCYTNRPVQQKQLANKLVMKIKSEAFTRETIKMLSPIKPMLDQIALNRVLAVEAELRPK